MDPREKRLGAGSEYKGASMIQGPRLDLVVLSGALLDAYLASDLRRAHQLAPFDFPDDFGQGDDGFSDVAIRSSLSRHGNPGRS